MKRGGGFLQNIPEVPAPMERKWSGGHGNTLKNCEACGKLVPCSVEAIGVTCGRCVQIQCKASGEQVLDEETQRAANVLAYRKRRVQAREARARRRGKAYG